MTAEIKYIQEIYIKETNSVIDSEMDIDEDILHDRIINVIA